MAIKFGDSLENQNADYPIVNAFANNVKGIIFNAGLPGNADFPEKREIGALLIDTTANNLYVYNGADTTDGNWGNSANWEQQSGDNTMGSSGLTDGDLDDSGGQTPAATITAATAVPNAVDAINEILGKIVPAAPRPWSSVYSSVSFSLSTTPARLVATVSPGGGAQTHDANGNASAPTAGDSVDWFSSHAISIATAISPTNDLIPTTLTAALSTHSVTLPAASSLASSPGTSEGTYTLQLVATYGDFPTSGNSQGFYSGVTGLGYTITDDGGTTTLDDGFHKMSITDGVNATAGFFYRAADLGAASLNTLSMQLNAAGTISYSSGVPHYTNPTWDIKFKAADLVPAGALVYGATSDDTDNDCIVGTAGSMVAAPASQQYSAFTTTSNNTAVEAGLSVTSLTTISAVANIVGKYGAFQLNSGSNTGPNLQAKSIHGDSTAQECALAGSGYHLYFDDAQLTQSSSNLFIIEDNMHTGLSASAGIRIQETTGAPYADTPSGATGTWGTWSRQFCNGGGSFAIDDKDLVARGYAANSFRLMWETTNLNSASFVAPATPPNFSARSGTDAQFATFKFPCDTLDGGASTITLNFQGSLGASGNLWVKIFDGGEAASLNDTNTGTNDHDGWVTATAATTGTGGPSVYGCATGGALTTATTEQTITLTSGTARWANASDDYIYVRVKLLSGGYVSKLGLTT
jgi:hypothetical protein